MTKTEALEKLELQEGASQAEIKQQYNEFYNEFQLRITNAPTEHQRNIYQKKLEELEEAYNLLTSGGSSSQDELPGIGESVIVEEEDKPAESKHKEKKTTESLSEKEALNLLDLKKPFTLQELTKAYNSKKEGFRKTAESTDSKSIKDACAKEIERLEKATELLSTIVQSDASSDIVHESSAQKTQNQEVAPKKKLKKASRSITPRKKIKVNPRKAIIFSIITVFIVSGGLVLNNWYKQKQREMLAKHQSEVYLADSLSLLLKWEEALPHYKLAMELMDEPRIDDSVKTINNRLQDDELLSWRDCLLSKSLVDYKKHITNFPSSSYLKQAERMISNLSWQYSIVDNTGKDWKTNGYKQGTAYAMFENNEHEIFVTGIIDDQSTYSSNKLYVAALTPGGSLNWKKEYNIDSYAMGLSVTQDTTNELSVIGGSGYISFDDPVIKILNIKLDEMGELKDKKYHRLNNKYGYTSPEKFMVSSFDKPQYIATYSQALFYSLNPDELSLNRVNIGGSIRNISPRKNGTIFCLGQTKDDLLLWKLSDKLEVIWEKKITKIEKKDRVEFKSYNLVELDNDEAIVVYMNGEKLHLSRFDSSGKLLNSELVKLPYSICLSSVSKTSANNIALTGFIYTNRKILEPRDGYIYKYLPNGSKNKQLWAGVCNIKGDLVWEYVDESKSSYGSQIIENKDGGFLICGRKNEYPFVCKLDKYGNHNF